MMWKKMIRAFLLPPMAIPIILLPVATVLLISAMTRTESDSVFALFED